ncbi:MAG: FAD-dependent oxidoreductase, partial [Alphaproteobacteria bacterium]
PARDAGRILDAVDFLKDADSGTRPKLGRRVAIYGGGNTAMDAARVAKRLGHEPLIIYRRDRDHMPAHAFEADEAVEEGVKIHWLRSIRGIEGSNVVVEMMELDENGRAQPTGEVEVLEADSLILALGQNVDADFLRRVPGLVVGDDGIVQVDANMMTGREGIFAGGDMVPAERTVTTAVGHGKKAARHIDGWLSGEPYIPPQKHPLVGFEHLHVWYFTEAPQSQQSRLDLPQRRDSFDEVLKGFSASEAAFEAQRCLSCGNCYECDGCYGACPERAIIKMGPGKGYSVAWDRCTGCAVCFEQCPCYAIEMVPEPVGAEP